MKRILAIMLVFCMCMVTCGCTNSSEVPENTTKTSNIDIVKGSALEYVHDTISRVIDENYYGNLSKSDILDSIIVSYEKEEINDNNFEIIAIYRCNIGKEYLNIKFEITGTVGEEEFNMYQIESYTSEVELENQLTTKEISLSEKKTIAEEQAISAIISYLKSTPGYTSYDIDSSLYKVGTITQGSGTAENHFTVNGTLYLYDKYGSLSDTATFSVTVVVEDDGYYNTLNPRIDK